LITLIKERAVSSHYGLRQALPAAASFSGLLDSLRNLFGLTSQAGNNPLDEFGDFPPLTISSAYFSIFGQSGD
jgi:hypothetical protein